MPQKNLQAHPFHGKPLIIAGLVLLIIGVLRFYNVDWPVVLMIVGALLLAKGLIIKSMKK